jgi:hypothetical protein
VPTFLSADLKKPSMLRKKKPVKRNSIPIESSVNVLNITIHSTEASLNYLSLRVKPCTFSSNVQKNESTS